LKFKQRKARKARNPRTGQRVDVPPKYVVTFKPGKEMEERVKKLSVLPVDPNVNPLVLGGGDADDQVRKGGKACAPRTSRKSEPTKRWLQ